MSDWITELKIKCDIVSIINSYVPLSKKGSRNYWGRCPFHNEKTASFSVNSEGQFYKCFGCGKSGDVITFVSEIEHFTFMEACKFLAEKVGFEIPESGNREEIAEESRLKEIYTAIMNEACTHYEGNLYLAQCKTQLQYLLSRGVSVETAKAFRLGASLGSSELIDYLVSKGYKVPDIAACGILDKREERYYDALYGRLIFPIINNYSNTIAFGGRVLEKVDFAKYKNSRESMLFSKSRTLYGINNLRLVKIEDKFDHLIMVEGYMDVIGLFGAGIRNVVASMGTALTEQQAKLIKRYCSKVYICYDGDLAGQKATARGMDILYSQGLEVFVLSMPDGMDPDEFVIKYGNGAFKKLVADAETLFDYKIRQNKNAYDLTTNEGRGKFAKVSLLELTLIKSDIEAMPYIERIAMIANMDKQFLLSQFRLEPNEEIMQKIEETKVTVVHQDESAYIKAIEFVLYCMATRKSFIKSDDLTDYIISTEHLEIYKTIVALTLDNKMYIPTEIADKLENKELYMKIMNKNEVVEEDDKLGEYYRDSIKKVKILGTESKIKSLSTEIENGAAANKMEAIMKLNNLHKLFKVLKGGV